MTDRPCSRRTFVRTGAIAGLGALAGCLSSGAGPEDGGDEAGSDEAADGEQALNPDLPYTATPEVVDLADQGFETTLRTESARHQFVTDAAPVGPVELPEVWAFVADDREPSVPGPLYRVPEGEEFSIHFQNDHERPHTIHVHALEKDWLDDGVPTTTGERVNPGEEKTYDLVADVPGTHMYHCHVQTDTHMDMGMYGLINVIPEDEDPPDQEYFLTLREWDTRLHRKQAGADVEYEPTQRSSDAYTINGRAAPTTLHPEEGCPLMVEEGDRVRVHVVNAGYEAHPFHTHGHQFEVVAKDGNPVPEAARQTQDVVNVAPAERYAIEFEADADPGIYPAHCHKVHHVTTEGNYPGGMMTAIVYDQATDTEQFQEVAKKAGAKV